jgi:hypothetical protein
MINATWLEPLHKAQSNEPDVMRFKERYATMVAHWYSWDVDKQLYFVNKINRYLYRIDLKSHQLFFIDIINPYKTTKSRN